MSKNTYRNRKHKRTALSPDGLAALRGFRHEAELVGEQLAELTDEFFSPTGAEKDWRNIKPIKPNQGPETE